MTNQKITLCLANSRKLSGRCISGKEKLQAGYGAWIRPVSARPSEEISEEERRYEDGVDPRILDIIEIPMLGHRPKQYQSENYLIDDGYYWVRAGRAGWADACNLVETVAGPLWVNGHSSYHGMNDRVVEPVAMTLTHSLTLIRPDGLKIEVASEGGSFGPPRRRVRAAFRLRARPESHRRASRRVRRPTAAR